MAPTLCTSGQVVLKAGANAPILNEAQYDSLIENAESFVNVSTKFDWIASYPSLTSGAKLLLSDTVASYAAIDLINYDMSGYTSRTEAQVMLDVNWSKTVEGINLLKDDNYRTFIQEGEVR